MINAEELITLITIGILGLTLIILCFIGILYALNLIIKYVEGDE